MTTTFSEERFLLIGAAGRNVGKTEFACRLIRRLRAGQIPVGAVKVTTVPCHGGRCPRGGRGCGVCSSFSGTHLLTEETDAPPGKDTGRMLAAGASPVLWLRVVKGSLEQGVAELLRRIPRGHAVICESNSARRALDPGVFLVIRQAGFTRVKSSCAQVIGDADAVLDYDGEGWSLEPGRIRFQDGRWHIRHAAAACVLAGGRSSRMGADKRLLDFGGRPLLAHVVDQVRPLVDMVALSANDPEKFRFLGLPVIPDVVPGQGPLMAIRSVLEATSADRLLVVGCDMPDIPPRIVNRLMAASAQADAAILTDPDGRPEPLFAVYRGSALAGMREALERGVRRILDGLNGARVVYVQSRGHRFLRNLNTLEEYRRANDERT